MKETFQNMMFSIRSLFSPCLGEMGRFVLYVFLVLSITACGDDVTTGEKDNNDDDDKTEKPDLPITYDSYGEQYRPQVHYTPQANWMNDPNGLVYMNGTWHLFFQFNPSGNNWGNMSWGHATSKDLMHWTQMGVVMKRDELGDIFSGSAVCDKDNTAGFGAGAMVCLFTHNGAHQQQSLAYSTDGGNSLIKYSGNPVIENNDKQDFRDPKVFWHNESSKWVMLLARGWSGMVDFYSSTDLKKWQYMSTFSMSDNVRLQNIQWECPDLVCLSGKYFLILSVNPGGPVLGSGTMYFPGEFDGNTFTADAGNYPMWLDYGTDNYAGVTWSNAPDGRCVYIGWMNNWNYAGDVPCTPWRSAMTLPRELSTITVNDQTYLAQHVVKEIDDIAGEWTSLSSLPKGEAYHLQVKVGLDATHVISLSNDNGERYDISVRGSLRTIQANRGSATGKADFNSYFSRSGIQGSLVTNQATETLDIYIDRSSVEIISENGTMSMTNLVFPSRVYNKVSVDGNAAQGRGRVLKRIWK